MIRKAIIPAAGLGTRMLSVTKEQTKEMLPVFVRNGDQLALKPLVQIIFEQLYDVGLREFCFIVGKGKRTIEEHFTPDRHFIKVLRDRMKHGPARGLEEFYHKIDSSNVVWINQGEPLGFGHAVLRAKPFMQNEPFLVHAGDTAIISMNDNTLRRLLDQEAEQETEACLLLQEVQDPRMYGVAEVREARGELRVTHVVEKPDHARSRLAIMPIYMFRPSIFDALERVRPDKSREIQLTDGIQRLIDGGYKVKALKMGKGELKLDIGTPESYWEAQRLSYEWVQRQPTEDD